MQIKQNTLLQFNNLSLHYGDNQILNNISGSIIEHSKIGLIGINGSGKSSLLKILTKQIKPHSGTIQSVARIEYLPQLDLEIYKIDKPLYKYLKENYEQWWDVLIKHKEIFGTSLDEDQSLKTLSGGELIKTHLSLVLSQNPDLILLDEPTNHLDLKSLKELENVLKNLNLPYIIVSHNIDFLNKSVNTIWELENGDLTVYGGNYDFYKNQKKLDLEARQRQYTAKKKKVRNLEDSLAKEQKRAQRSQRTGRKFAKFGGTDGFAQTYFKDRSEKSAGTNSNTLIEKRSEIIEDMEKYKTETRKTPYLKFNTKPRNGLIIKVSDGMLSINNSLILLDSVNLKVLHGERIAILGDNGSGKTTFVKQLAYNEADLLNGDIKYGSKYKTLFVDQKYDVVKPELTVIENIQEHNPKINYENSRRILGNLSFPMDYDINKIAGELSGGETARLAFAIATSSEVDLFVLDEPTNNLDIETIDVIVEALQEFQGTLVVISHDIAFLERINIEIVYEIIDKSLVKSDLSKFNSKKQNNV